MYDWIKTQFVLIIPTLLVHLEGRKNIFTFRNYKVVMMIASLGCNILSFSLIPIMVFFFSKILDKDSFLSFLKYGEKGRPVNALQPAGSKVATFAHTQARQTTFKTCQCL